MNEFLLPVTSITNLANASSSTKSDERVFLSEGKVEYRPLTNQIERCRKMKFEAAPFSTTEWSTITPTEHQGEKGSAHWRTVETGNIRVRMVEYSPGYVADHWCARGHVLLVLEGELITELKDGRKFTLRPGYSYQVADDETNPHRSRTDKGAKLFIVD